MKIAFCGHSHHKVTQSTVFLRELLQQEGDVAEFWDTSWLSGTPMDIAPIVAGNFDCIVVFQMELLAQRLTQAALKNITFFPMYDGCHTLPDSYWQSLGDTKIVSFSSTLYEKLLRLGSHCRFARYWPDPARYAPVEHGGALAGYFWQRQQDVTWHTLRPLLGERPFDRFTLHKALDPSFGDFISPNDEEVARHSIRITEWFASREHAAADLRQHNVYFAPRLREGIGMSFLEAMAMGFLVVGPDHPTMNEYIFSGVNGLLYDPLQPHALEFSAHAELGRRARLSVVQGREKWLRCIPALLQYIRLPPIDLASQTHIDAFDPLATENQNLRRTGGRGGNATAAPPVAAHVAVNEGGKRLRGPIDLQSGAHVAASAAANPQAHAAEPLVSIAVVTRNAEASLHKTLDSIFLQDFADKEIIVLDGLSQDATLDIIREYDDQIDYWRSAADAGPYDAMNVAARLAKGRYIIFMNAGDWFQSSDALSQVFETVLGEPDVIYGHHVYRSVAGHDEIHKAMDFGQTTRQLAAGDVGWQWQAGVPGHQATLTKSAVLREHPYRNDLRIAADHEFLHRLAARGGTFHHCATVVATYVGGGLSWQSQERCFDEWRTIAAQYTAQPQKVAAIFSRMHAEMQASLLRRVPWRQRLSQAFRGHHAVAVLAWRVRKRLERMWKARVNRGRVLRVDFSDGDISRHLHQARGLSLPEGWGRWSDGARVEIEFRQPVRNAHRLSIEIHNAFGPNIGKQLVVRVGASSYHHKLVKGPQRFSTIFAAEHQAVSRVELLIPEPASPESLEGIPDKRRLGVAVSALELHVSSG